MTPLAAIKLSVNDRLWQQEQVFSLLNMLLLKNTTLPSISKTVWETHIGPLNALHVYLVTCGSSPPRDHMLMNNIIKQHTVSIITILRSIIKAFESIGA